MIMDEMYVNRMNVRMMIIEIEKMIMDKMYTDAGGGPKGDGPGSSPPSDHRTRPLRGCWSRGEGDRLGWPRIGDRRDRRDAGRPSGISRSEPKPGSWCERPPALLRAALSPDLLVSAGGGPKDDRPG